MGFNIIGAIEGFYGEPWSWDARESFVRFWGDRGGTDYLYAPKDDPLHRSRWREPYDQATLDRFSTLASVGEAAGVRVGWAISPGLTMCYSSDADFEALHAKVTAMIGCGAGLIGILFDDVPPRFADARDVEEFGSGPGALGVAHAGVTNRLAAAIDVPVVMCPTDYVGTLPTAYLERLGSTLNPEVPVGWTGPTVVSGSITAAAAASRASTVQRPLALWDNYPCNDVFMSEMLHLGPIRNRDPELADHVSAVFFNVMSQPVLCRLPMATAAAWARDPAGYDPFVAWEAAIREVGDRFADPLAALAAACTQGPWEERPAPHMAMAVDAAIDSIGRPEWQHVWSNLASFADTAAWARRELESSPFWREGAPWIETLGVFAQVVVTACSVMQASSPVIAITEDLDGCLTAQVTPTSGEARMMAWGALMLLWQRSQKRREVVWGPRLAMYPQLVQTPVEGLAGFDPSMFAWNMNHVDRLVEALLTALGSEKVEERELAVSADGVPLYPDDAGLYPLLEGVRSVTATDCGGTTTVPAHKCGLPIET